MVTTIVNNTGKKYALVIGINYNGNTQGKLNGCINDANNIKQYLLNKCNYKLEDICMLTDEPDQYADLIPNKQNIINGINTLIQKGNEGYTELWLSYSGHGSYLPDYSQDENDGRDEILCPCDYSANGFITDDYIYSNLVCKLSENITLFALIDACHSGTMLDLPFIYKNNEVIKNGENGKVPLATVVKISGCRDDQTSADAYINSKYAGAMTWSFLRTLTNCDNNVNCKDLVNGMKKRLKLANYSQIPVLTISNENLINVNYMGMPLPAVIINELPHKNITLNLTTDYWYGESSWNIWSYNEKKYLYEENNKFISRYQTVTVTLDLSVGKYSLWLLDSYGDGGISATVFDNETELVNVNMVGSSNEILFNVE